MTSQVTKTPPGARSATSPFACRAAALAWVPSSVALDEDQKSPVEIAALLPSRGTERALVARIALNTSGDRSAAACGPMGNIISALGTCRPSTEARTGPASELPALTVDGRERLAFARRATSLGIVEEYANRTLVMRLSGPHACGGAVIQRAAILAARFLESDGADHRTPLRYLFSPGVLS